MNMLPNLPPATSSSSVGDALLALLDLVRDPARAQEHIKSLRDHEPAARHAIQQANEAHAALQKARTEHEAEVTRHNQSVQSAHDDLRVREAAWAATAQDERTQLEAERVALANEKTNVEKLKSSLELRLSRIAAVAAA